jgi:YHS domain-containing protein
VLRYLLVLVLLTIVARAFWRVMDGVIEGATGRPRQAPGPTPTKLARDPVCGTYIVPNRALSLSAGGSTHYFCSEQCRTTYRGEGHA